MISKRVKGYVSFVLALTLAFAGSVNTYAFSDGTYTAETKTYYLNPDTGRTDDGGTGNIELGEGMCRSAVYESAFIEQKGGRVYITVRMLLYSNLSNIRIAVQDTPKGNYTSVNYTVEKESSSWDSGDLKFEVPGTDSYIQVKMYVRPMGRDVCFYIQLDTQTAKQQSTFTDAQDMAEKSNGLFTDISGHWAKDAIETVVEAGLFSGTAESTFSPEETMTRGMFVTVLGRLSGEDVSKYGSSEFKDVSPDQYYANYVHWASDKGLVRGTGAHVFSPDEPVTCEQAAVIMVKFAEYKGVKLTVKSISPGTAAVSRWAKEDVVTAGKAGLITKQNTKGYDYTSNATRAGVASMIANYIEYYQ